LATTSTVCRPPLSQFGHSTTTRLPEGLFFRHGRAIHSDAFSWPNPSYLVYSPSPLPPNWISSAGHVPISCPLFFRSSRLMPGVAAQAKQGVETRRKTTTGVEVSVTALPPMTRNARGLSLPSRHLQSVTYSSHLKAILQPPANGKPIIIIIIAFSSHPHPSTHKARRHDALSQQGRQFCTILQQELAIISLMSRMPSTY